jgi:hypothetical protein
MVVSTLELLVTTILCDSSTHNCNHDHNYNAGILAGMRPCGTIVLLSELFISESERVRCMAVYTITI